MTPLVGLVPAKTFVGFETEDQGVKVLVAELPADAYGEVVNAFKANPAGSQRHQAREHRDRRRRSPITPPKTPRMAPPACGAIR